MGAQRMGGLIEAALLQGLATGGGASVNLLAALIAALGPLAGLILGKFTKEELAPGKKYFIAAKHVLFAAVIAAFLFAFKSSLWHDVVGFTALFAYLAYAPFKNQWLVGAILALAFVFTQSTPLAFLTAALIFLHGLPTGSLLTQKKDGVRSAALLGIVFLAIVTAAYFL